MDKKPFSAFLLKLYRLLEDTKNIDIVSWSLDGKSFIIKNIHTFCSEILPNYFKHKNFSSFLRQVSITSIKNIKIINLIYFNSYTCTTSTKAKN